METTLHLRLLGDFSLLYNDQQVTSLNTVRLQSLLAYLVLHRDVPQQRQHLAFLFNRPWRCHMIPDEESIPACLFRIAG
jgi:hypothetical protein